MEIFLVPKLKGTFLELEILMSLLIIWKEKVDILYLKLSLVKLESIYVMEGIILFIGWDLGSMELKLFIIHLLQLMDYLNLCGALKLEMLQLLTTTLALVSIVLVLRNIQTNLQAVMAKKQKNNLVISMVVPMWQPQMVQELPLYPEQAMVF